MNRPPSVRHPSASVRDGVLRRAAQGSGKETSGKFRRSPSKGLGSLGELFRELWAVRSLSLIHISEPTRLALI
eukprot:2387704-Alexandrium_andersonii.AAC.1